MNDTDTQDIEAHLKGGIPNTDIDTLENYWEVYPTLKDNLFEPLEREGYSKLRIDKEEIKNAIYSYKEFIEYTKKVNFVFETWKNKNIPLLKSIDKTVKPKELIHTISEDLLETFRQLQLIDEYDIYQHLMDYWLATMQDDAYSIADDDWLEAGGKVYRLIKKIKDNKKNKTEEKEIEGIEGIESKLIPPQLLIDLYFENEKREIEKRENERNSIAVTLEEMEEEYGGDEGLLSEATNDKDKITESSAKKRLKEIVCFAGYDEEIKVLKEYLKWSNKKKEADKKIKIAKALLERLVWDKYGTLSVDEIKHIVVDLKWVANLDKNIQQELQRISYRLTHRIKELADRYESPMSSLIAKVRMLENKVNAHLKQMGFVWEE